MPNASDRSGPRVSVRSAELSVEIDPLGAQLSVLRDAAGRDLLWDGNPAFWNGRAPLLFPIVGALAGGAYRLGEQRYRLPRHGFARGRMFVQLASSPSAVTFGLTADAASLEVYPFRFELEVRFAVAGATLAVTTRVRNAGADVMPASFGYHPAFRWPLPYGRARQDHFVEFAQDEPDPVRRLDGAGLLKPEKLATPISHRRLALADALFEKDALILDQVRSRSVTYGAQDGPRLRIAYPDAPYLGLWSKPAAGFICVEPWHGIADPAGFNDDFRNKPGIFSLAAGASRTIEMTVTLLAA